MTEARSDRATAPDARRTAGPGLCGAARPADAQAGAAAWRWALAALALGAAAVLALYWDTAKSIALIWWDSPAFSHGFLIAPISAVLMWQQRARLAALAPRPSILGLAGAAGAALAWLISETAAVQSVQQFALVAVLQCLFLAVLGLRITAVIAFPLFYLYFGVPFGTFLIAPLQDLTAAFIVRILQLIGMPVYLDGIFIHIPSGSFEVAEACAGLRFLITSIALGVIFAHVFYRQSWRRALFVGLSVIVPIFANGLRATSIVLLAHYSDYQYAAGADHITYGLIFLSIVLLCLLGIGYSFKEPPRDVEAAPAAPAARTEARVAEVAWLRITAAAAGVALIAAASSSYAALVGGRPPTAGIIPSLPAPETWQAAPPAHADWKPAFLNVSHEILQGFTDGSRHVDLYVAYFAQQRQGAEVVNWSNSLAGARPWLRAGSGATETEAAGQAITVNYERIVARDRARIVWYWYWVDGRLTASPYVAKVLEVKAKLLGGEQAAAVIALAADYGDDPRTAQGTLSSFLARTWPIDRVFARTAR